MTPIVFVAVALAGGTGAVARFLLDGFLQSRATSYPLGTLVINVSGSFLLGLVTGLALSALVPSPVFLILGSGFLGGYTTFSTASVESVRLIQARRYGVALVNSVGMLVLAVLASAAGFLLGSF
ncbi:fluoride efflux transporter CrcB [Mycetocola sp.]|uniref:fluoride efflux transporter CrcB n=1 Tax=Mycetocola sp. TaxID=1871042 RepID=UPI0039890F28